MNIYQFIDSVDIRNYLQEIHYEFTAPETAFLIYRSRRAAIHEKFSAWQEIIDTMPDCSMEERINMEAIPSFHRFLAEYIAILKDLLEQFSRQEDAVYTYAFYEKEGRCFRSGSKAGGEFEWVEEGNYFQDFQTALSHLRKNYPEESFEKVRFTKQFFSGADDSDQKKLFLEMNPDLEILSINEQGALKDSQPDLFVAFEGMWFSFPTPFRRGDILINRATENKPFVLEDISTWGSEEMLKNGYPQDNGRVKNADRTIERRAEGFGCSRQLSLSGKGKENRRGITLQYRPLLFHGRTMRKKQKMAGTALYRRGKETGRIL